MRFVHWASVVWHLNPTHSLLSLVSTRGLLSTKIRMGVSRLLSISGPREPSHSASSTILHQCHVVHNTPSAFSEPSSIWSHVGIRLKSMESSHSVA